MTSDQAETVVYAFQGFTNQFVQAQRQPEDPHSHFMNQSMLRSLLEDAFDVCRSAVNKSLTDPEGDFEAIPPGQDGSLRSVAYIAFSK